MFNSEILDVAIGLIFIYLMLSLVVTAMNELVAAWLKRRSKTLWSGIVRLLGNKEFAEEIYTHPLISSLSQSAARKPSYIPSRTFALALLDRLTEAGTPPPSTREEIANAIARLPETEFHLKTTLTVLLHDAGNDMQEFKKLLEQWFEGAMERVSGWYKRQTQWFLIIFAALLTVWTNCDTVSLANTLWRDPVIRASLVTQAKQYVDEHKTENVAQNAPSGTTAGPPPPPVDPPAEAPEYEQAAENFNTRLKALRGLGIPLGWGDPETPEDRREPVPTTFSGYIDTVVQHGLGWLLSALAISLGAPFWFDMLNKVVAIRSSGKAPEEKQKAPKKVPTPQEPGGARADAGGTAG